MRSNLTPPYPPMEARLVKQPPRGEQWQYEPKWDGFRCLAFRNGSTVYLQSKAGRPLSRYFPDLVKTLLGLRAKQFVLDGEIVIPIEGRLSFDDLLLRVHPAESRVRTLAAKSPASFIVFDFLMDERGENLTGMTQAVRRRALEQFFGSQVRPGSGILLSPATDKLEVAKKWFDSAGVNLDGMIAKRLDLPYRSGERDGMQKIKFRRTADCVVGGFRYAEGESFVGSLLLGLFDKEGLLHHVGFTSGIKKAERVKVTRMLKPLIKAPGFTGRAPGGPSRWSTERSAEWQPLAPKLVVEVEYDHFTGNRFRHGTKLVRWRPDKKPSSCTMDQIVRARGKYLPLFPRTQKSRTSRMPLLS